MKFLLSGSVLIPLAVVLLHSTAFAQVGFELKDISEAPGPEVAYEEGTGLPLTVPIVFDSDIDIGAPDTLGKAWVVWSWVETEGESLYTAVTDSTSGTTFSSSTAPISDGIVTFALTRTTSMPRIATYTFTLNAKLMHQNTADLDILLYERSYVISVQRKGTTVSGYTLDSNSGTSEFAATAETASSPLVPVASPATGLAVVPVNGPFTYPSPIVLSVSSADPFYKVWMSDTASVKVFADAGLSDLRYEWPSSLVASSAIIESTAGVTITLNSVPETLYDLTTIYIALNVDFRDTEGDLHRSLRGLERGEEQKASVIAEVRMVTDKKTSSGGASSSQFKFWIFTLSSFVAGPAGAGLLL